ncbi:hypothetical protein AAC387_Pa02g1455 [Persea americana]
MTCGLVLEKFSFPQRPFYVAPAWAFVIPTYFCSSNGDTLLSPSTNGRENPGTAAQRRSRNCTHPCRVLCANISSLHHRYPSLRIPWWSPVCTSAAALLNIQ